jgi:rubrerythrin
MNTIDRRAYEGDIVSRLKNWRGLHLAHSGELFDEAADEIARLRGDAQVARLRLEAAHGDNAHLREAIRRLADQDATLSVQGGSVTVTMDATLTEKEREAIEQMLDEASGKACAESWVPDTLRNLLKRLK